MYVLNLAKDNRILSVWGVIEGQDYGDMPMVEKRPEDLVPADATEKEKDCNNYLYVDGEYIYDPLPEPIEPTGDEVTTDDLAMAILEGVNEV